MCKAQINLIQQRFIITNGVRYSINKAGHTKKVKAMIALSIPYGGRALVRPTDHMKKVFAVRLFYIFYFQEVGRADLHEELSSN